MDGLSGMVTARAEEAGVVMPRIFPDVRRADEPVCPRGSRYDAPAPAGRGAGTFGPERSSAAVGRLWAPTRRRAVDEAKKWTIDIYHR